MIGKAVFPGGNAQSLNDVAGQPIAEYTHAKSGTVHKLEGPAKAKSIVFKATGDYSDGDTWTLNNTPVTVTYNGGEELLPTAVLIGDMVQAVVMGNQVRLMLQKTTPQESISDNGNFDVNQQNKTEYVGSGYTVDRWLINSSSDGYSLKVHDGYIEFINNGKNSVVIRQFLEQLPPGTYTMAVLTGNGLKYGTVVWDGSTGVSAPTSFGSLFIGIMSNRIHMSIFVNSGKTEKFYAAKLEPGKRFTGWPAWDYGAELAKCQRYQIEIFDKKITGQSYLAQVKAINSTSAYGIIPIPVSMRDGVIPAIGTDCSADSPYLAFGIFSSGYNSEGKIIKISVYSKMNNSVILVVTGSNFVQGNDYQLYVKNTNMHHFLLNANL